ncbi:hypothetical protein [Ornithinicoccus halotolerans]|uniref:hypothetical protein n=1 Tax=Ornithinicoccus halotolerans TaxID=1748220 RepID=UPI00129794F7|nr:hypothetical protein [Ornithinicoccus halotolerans]
MSVLPASVRVALWATAALRDGSDLAEVAERALPDLDHCTGLLERLQLWRSLGEQVVLAALVRPGDLTAMPHGPQQLVAAATEAEELVYVPGTGGALVPWIGPYGPEVDRGWRVHWEAFDADPVPVHRLEQLDLGDVELRLRTELAALTDGLGDLRGVFATVPGLEQQARQQLAAGWGLPRGLPRRAVRTLDLAATAGMLARAAQDERLQTVDASTYSRREVLLTRLRARADEALGLATNVAVMHLAGWR